MANGHRVPHTDGVATALIVVALLIGGLGAIRWRRRGGAIGPAGGKLVDLPAAAVKAPPLKRSGKKPTLPVVPADDLLAGSADVDDLDAVFDRVLESHSRELGILLASRLQRLVDRRVPVRAIREAPGTSAARVCFADGTIVLARGVVPGDFVRIAWGIHASSVWLEGFSRVDATTRLDLRWHEGRVAVVALGLDQPD